MNAAADRHRQRLRHNWAKLIPLRMANQQAAYEMDCMILRARAAGATLREIGAKLGVCKQRVRSMEMRARRRRGSPIGFMMCLPLIDVSENGQAMREIIGEFAALGVMEMQLG